MKNEPFRLSGFPYEAALELIRASAEGRITLTCGQQLLHAHLKPNPFLKNHTPGATSRYFMDDARNLFLTVNDSYATLRCSIDATDYALVAYRDREKNAEIKRLYEERMPAPAQDWIRSGATNESLLLNITEIVKTSPLKGAYDSVPRDDRLPGTKRLERGKGNVIMLHLLKDSSQRPMEHEVDWQMNNVIKSLNFLNPPLHWGLYLYEKEFRGTDRAQQTLYAFRDWVKVNESSADYDLFFLVRWGKWSDDKIGCAFKNVYDVNQYEQKDAYGVTATTCLYPWVMGHEMGHIFGAEHVQDEADIMFPTSHTLCTGRHRDRANVDMIKKNGTYIPR